MNFDEFKEAVLATMQERFGSDVEVFLKTQQKNNGVVLEGLSLKKSNNAVSPVFYLEEFYERYKREDMNIDEVCDELMDAYNGAAQCVDFDVMEHFNDFDWIKKRLVANLVNTELNKELLKDVPNVLKADLSVVFRIKVTSEEAGEGSILVRNEHLAIWGATVNDLMAAASDKRNTFMRPVFDARFAPAMYVLTNESKLHGAAVLLNEKFMREFAEQFNKSLVILPSSVHEVIAVPTDVIDEATLNNFEEMVRSVNTTQLREDEVLSNHPYVYDIESKQLLTPEEYLGGVGGQKNVHTM